MNLASLTDIVSKELQMNMKDRDAKSRIQGLFINYIGIVRRNDLNRIIAKKLNRGWQYCMC